MESEFAENLKRNIFRIPVCKVCKKKVWPPSLTCPLCYSRTVLKSVSTKGVLVEFSTSYLGNHEGIFGIVQMDGFKMMGSFDNPELSKGMRVRMKECGLRDGRPYFCFVPEATNDR